MIYRTNYIIIKNIGVNTEYCFDMNGSQEFKCECNEGYDGKRCEVALCPFNCENNGICLSKIDEFGKKIWQCKCQFPFEGETKIYKFASFVYV